MVGAHLKLSTEGLEDALPQVARLREHLHGVADVRRRRVHEVRVVVHALRHDAASRRSADSGHAHLQTCLSNLCTDADGPRVDIYR